MSSLLLILKLAIPFAALLGISMFFVYRLKMPCAFSFALACGGVVFVSFVGGYINMLPQTVLLQYAFGLICLAYYLVAIIRKKHNASFITSPATLVFIIACALCVLTLRNFRFATHDEYSHWGIMIKEMATTNTFPAKDSIIRFIDYPPATSLFMYFFIYSTGFSQSIAYIAQGFFAMAPLMVFFHYSSFKRPLSLLAPIAISAVLMLTFESTLQYLLVDYLVGLYAIAAIVTVLFMKNKIAIKPISTCLIIMPLIVASALIKTSALFYAILACVILCIIIIRDKTPENPRLSVANKIQLGFILSSPLWIWFLFQKHAEMLFGTSRYKQTQFTLVPENLAKNFSERPPQFRADIIKDSILSLFTVKASLCALTVLALSAIVVYFFRRKGKKPALLISLTLAGGISYIIYYIGYVLALLFMFPYEELVAFNTTTIAISRYISAASGACLGVCLFGLLDTVNALPRLGLIKKSAVSLAAAVLFVPFINIPIGERSVYSNQAEAQIREVEAFATQYSFAREDSLLFYNGDYDDNNTDCGYNNYTYTNSFLNNNVSSFSNTHLQGGSYEYTDYKLKHFFINNDYLVVMSESPELYNILDGAQISYDAQGGAVYKIDVLDDGSIYLSKTKS